MLVKFYDSVFLTVFYGVTVHDCATVYESVLICSAVNDIEITHYSQLSLLNLPI